MNLSATYSFLATDKDGNPRPASGAWDIGACVWKRTRHRAEASDCGERSRPVIRCGVFRNCWLNVVSAAPSRRRARLIPESPFGRQGPQKPHHLIRSCPSRRQFGFRDVKNENSLSDPVRISYGERYLRNSGEEVPVQAG